jgi:hypothetical protein
MPAPAVIIHVRQLVGCRRVHEGDVALVAFQLWREVVACTPARFHWLIALISVRERDAAAMGLAASGAHRGIAKDM